MRKFTPHDSCSIHIEKRIREIIDKIFHGQLESFVFQCDVDFKEPSKKGHPSQDDGNGQHRISLSFLMHCPQKKLEKEEGEPAPNFVSKRGRKSHENVNPPQDNPVTKSTAVSLADSKSDEETEKRFLQCLEDLELNSDSEVGVDMCLDALLKTNTSASAINNAPNWENIILDNCPAQALDIDNANTYMITSSEQPLNGFQNAVQHSNSSSGPPVLITKSDTNGSMQQQTVQQLNSRPPMIITRNDTNGFIQQQTVPKASCSSTPSSGASMVTSSMRSRKTKPVPSAQGSFISIPAAQGSLISVPAAQGSLVPVPAAQSAMVPITAKSKPSETYDIPHGYTYESWILSEGLHKARKMGLHKNTDKDYFPFMCPLCGKRYRNPNGIKYHAKYAHGPKCVFTCDICQKAYATRHGLAAHKRSHQAAKVSMNLSQIKEEPMDNTPEQESQIRNTQNAVAIMPPAQAQPSESEPYNVSNPPNVLVYLRAIKSEPMDMDYVD